MRDGSLSHSWLVSLVKPYRKQIAFSLALGVTATGCAALLMFTSGYLISATAIVTTTLFSIMTPIACVQLFGFGRPLARYFERLASHDWVLRVTSDLRLGLYRAIEHGAHDPEQARAAGEYLELLSDDVGHLQNIYLRVALPTAIAYALALGASLLFGFFSVPFALIILLSFVLVVGVLPLVSLFATRALTSRVKTSASIERTALFDDVAGSTDWVLSGRGNDAVLRHETHDDAIRAEKSRLRMRKRCFTLCSAIILGGIACLVLVWAGATFGGGENPTSPEGSVNWIAAFTLGFFPLIEAFALLPASLSDYSTHHESVKRLESCLDTRDARAGNEPERIPPLVRFPPAQSAAPCAITFESVSYAYPHSPRTALDNLSLEIAPACKIAVLGKSGAGKSTFARLLCGTLAPNSGVVRLGNHDVIAGEADLSHFVGYVGQEPYLFNRTLRENLALGDPTASDADLMDALESVGLGQKARSLPAGLDTVIGETGVGFSGGEAHRVSLARVLVAHTPIIVVDEPFAALDPKTERELLDTLFAVCEKRTLVVITHHLAEIERFDRVVFMKAGKIELDGSPDGLFATSEKFRTLAEFDRSAAV